jgi:uncharacterized NAD(P)/FAD-binding protein YdhS
MNEEQLREHKRTLRDLTEIHDRMHLQLLEEIRLICEGCLRKHECWNRDFNLFAPYNDGCACKDK